MGETTFVCSACGKAHKVDLSRLPPQGAKGSCQGCGAPITLYPDGTIEGGRRQEPYAASENGGRGFRCPLCGHLHSVDLSKIPVHGVKGSCKGCGATLLVMPDGSVTSPDAPPSSPPKPAAAPRTGGKWRIQQGEETLGPFTTEELGELAATGGLSPEKRVSRDGETWAEAGTFGELAGLFATGAAAAGVAEEYTGNEDECHAHPGRVPTRLCSKCGRYLCDECLKPSGILGSVKPILLCGACGGTTMVVKRREKWTPFYRDMGQVLAVPLKKGHALLYFFFLTFLEILKIPCRFAPMFGLAAIFILTCLQLTFYLHVIREVANGSYEIPEWPESDNFLDMVVLFLKVLAVTLISLAPAILLSCFAGIGLGFMAGLSGAATKGSAMAAIAGPILIFVLLLTALYLVYLPVCVAIVSIFNTVVPALNPVIIFRIIARIGKPYFLAVLLWGALIVIDLGFRGFAGGVVMLGAVLMAPLEVYLNLVSSYILGRVCYENEEKIGWH